ncbi:Uncharacterised protein g7976 [Pycnogonum litorale]
MLTFGSISICYLSVYDYLDLVPLRFSFYRSAFGNGTRIEEDSEKDPQQFGSRRLLLDTENCQIPDFDPFDPSVQPYFYRPNELVCDGYPLLTYTIGEVIHVNHDEMDKLKTTYSKVWCCINGYHSKPGAGSDKQIWRDSNCMNITFPQILAEEYSEVRCSSENGTIVYLNYHAIFKSEKNSSETSKDDDLHYNVLVLGLDSVSRLNFHRHMNKTKEVLIGQLKAIELKVYNMLGQSTIPNLIPMLTGSTFEEIKSTCSKTKQPFDNCTFVWSEFKDRRYKTMYAEDCTHISTFNYLQGGFAKKPTDYYFRPFLSAIEDEIGSKKPHNCKLCLGPLTSNEVMLKYTYDFFNEFKNDKKFAFTWINSLTHDALNWPSISDGFCAQFFKNMSDSGVLNRTIVFFLSDHGMRWGGILSTYVGKLEKNLPFSFVYLPKSFKERYPRLTTNLEINAKRLVTPFDIYSTLANIARFDGSFLAPDKLFANETKAKRSQSLFGEISKNRSCRLLNIPQTLCSCHLSFALNVSSERVIQEADFMVQKINGDLDSVRHLCSELKLGKIKYAREIVLTDDQTTVSSSSESDDGRDILGHILQITTIPGNARFEAFVKSSEFKDKQTNETLTKTSILEKIGRISLYGNQSYCVHERRLKELCFCKGRRK